MLIAEQLMLLCIDPQRGDFEATRAHADINALAAAALILDLYEQRRLRFRNGHIAVEVALPTSHPQLTTAVEILAAPVNALPVEAAIDLLVPRMHPISRHLLESLFRRDVLHRVRASWLPWSALHFPLRSLQVLNEARSQLRKATETGAPSVRGLGLLVLTDFAGKLADALSGDAHEIAAARLLHLGGERTGDDDGHDLIVHLRRSLLA
jgi:hypothetical protein